MDDSDKQKEEQNKLNELMKSSDGSSLLKVNHSTTDPEEELPGYEEVEKTQKPKKPLPKKNTRTIEMKDIVEGVTPILNKAVDSITRNQGNSVQYAIEQIVGSISSELSNVLAKIPEMIASSIASSMSELSPTHVPHHRAISSSVNTTPHSRISPVNGSSHTFPNHVNRSNSSNGPSTSISNHFHPYKPKAKPIQKLPPCLFCTSFNHLTRNCTHTTSVATRLSILSVNKRCHKCFRPASAVHHSCDPPQCRNGCVNDFGVPDRHCEWLCPLNPDLTP